MWSYSVRHADLATEVSATPLDLPADLPRDYAQIWQIRNRAKCTGLGLHMVLNTSNEERTEMFLKSASTSNTFSRVGPRQSRDSS